MTTKTPWAVNITLCSTMIEERWRTQPGAGRRDLIDRLGVSAFSHAIHPCIYPSFFPRPGGIATIQNTHDAVPPGKGEYRAQPMEPTICCGSVRHCVGVDPIGHDRRRHHIHRFIFAGLSWLPSLHATRHCTLECVAVPNTRKVCCSTPSASISQTNVPASQPTSTKQQQ